MLLQRGVRMNAQAGQGEVWCAWVRLEMRFVESVRRRWEVLGIDGGADEGSEEEAQQKVMEGAIVKEVLQNALKGDHRTC